LSPGEKCRSKKGQGERRADGQRSRNQIDHRAGAGFSLFKYCSHSEPGLNCGNPTLRFGEVLDFSLSLRLRHPLLDQQRSRSPSKTTQNPRSLSLLRDLFSKNFQSIMPFVSFLMFISSVSQMRRLGVI
jgi:hypothetical protein